MVTAYSNRGGGFRRIRPPRLRVQHRLQSFQLYWRRDHRLGACAGTPSRHIRGDAEPGGQPCKLRQISSPHQGHYHLLAARPEEKAVQIKSQAK